MRLNFGSQVFNFDAIHMKMEGSAPDEKSSFEMLGISSFLNIIGVQAISFKNS